MGINHDVIDVPEQFALVECDETYCVTSCFMAADVLFVFIADFLLSSVRRSDESSLVAIFL